MKIIVLTSLVALLVGLAFLPNYSTTSAHQSGCHRWHSCPSDSGSYTCGDAGYACRYPTYPQNGGYTPPPKQSVPSTRVTQPSNNSGGGNVQGTQTTNSSSNDDTFWWWVIGLGIVGFVIWGATYSTNKNNQNPD